MWKKLFIITEGKQSYSIYSFLPNAKRTYNINRCNFRKSCETPVEIHLGKTMF